jgi:NitT/TauT family transport system substrate-binding protein
MLTAVAAALTLIALVIPAAQARPADTAGPAVIAGSSATPLKQIRLAVFPSLDYAPMFLGLRLGVFKKHGLELKIQYVYTGAGLFAAVTSGAVDLATNSPTAGSNAISNGLPIRMLTAADYQPIQGNTEVLVKADSPIRTFADLAGKTVATINLQGLFHLGLSYAVEQAGVDPKSIKALAMSPADEGPALLAGRVDAIVLQDPFLTINLEQGGFRSLGNPFKVFPFRVPVGAFWASNEGIEKNADLLRSFLAAWKECVAIAKRRPGATRSVVTRYTAVTSDLAGKITMPDYTHGLPPNTLGPMLVLMKKYGWVSTIPSYNQIYWGGR